MNAVAQIEPRRSVTADMAGRFGMEPAAFEQTLRATVFPGNGTKEQFAAFLLVAKLYDLNPITKELYAFPAKGGGIVPIVSIDGWLKLINSHPQFDGMEFEDRHDDKGDLLSVTCRLWRKDRSKPIVVTEYLAECFRPTEPWKMKHRMLRHKSLIQTARYAFGFAGIYDPDEGERIVEAQSRRDMEPRREPPAPPAERPAQTPPAAQQRAAPRLPPAPPPAPPKAAPAPAQATIDESDFNAFCEAFRAELRSVGHTSEESDGVYQRLVESETGLTEDQREECDAILREHCASFCSLEE